MLAVIVISATGILVALLVTALIYGIGVYLLHAPQRWVAVIALLVLVLMLLGNVGDGSTVGI